MVALLLVVAFDRADANLLTNPGFETREATANGLPTTFGKWSGDLFAIVPAENGIIPPEGLRMLRFLGTSPTGGGGVASSLWQLVDVSAFSAAIATGTARASAQARFNRVVGDAQTDTQFSLQISAFAGLPGDFPTATPLATITGAIFSDGDPGTWEILSVALPLPPGTTYLMLLLAAAENVSPEDAPEFHGHYVDAAVLTVAEVFFHQTTVE